MSKVILCGECLRFMQSAYRDSERELFSMDDLAEALPDYSRKDITNAMTALQTLGIVTVKWADDEAYMNIYNPDGVTDLITKKGAGAVKDVVGWVIGCLQ